MKTNDFKSIIIQPKHIFPQLKDYINHISFNKTLIFDNSQTALPSLPDGMCELVICLGNPYYRSKENNKLQFDLISQSHLVGLKTRNSFLIPTQGAKAISVRFQPGCFTAFVKHDLQEFTDKIIHANEIFGKEFTLLEQRILESTSIEDQVTLIQQFLVSRLSVNENLSKFIRLVRNVYQEKKGFSVKHKGDYKKQERLFSKYTGTTPKKFQQIVNFNYARKLISDPSKHSLTKIAHLCNYYDQSHFIKKFKEFSGLKPTEYANLNSELIRFEQSILHSIL